MILTLLIFLLGLIVLTCGAELLVRGASRFATAAGVSKLVVGLTVVAFGTSAPELAVSLGASWQGQSAIAVGNVVGSNIFNVLFILAISAVITPLVVQAQLVRFDVPVMVTASVAVLVLGLDGSLSRVDGVVLFAGLVVYLSILIRSARRDSRAGLHQVDAESQGSIARGLWPRLFDLGLVVVGLVLLVVGSRLLLAASLTVARALGVSELIIGLTLVAAGTSLPEVATSIMAAVRGERDIAVGNVVGSNVFNLLAVLGLSAAVSPSSIQIPDSALRFDLPVMTAVAIACLPIFFTGHRVARWEGLLLLGYYFAYTVYLALASQQHDAAQWFRVAMLGFVVPLTAITLIVTTIRAVRARGVAR